MKKANKKSNISPTQLQKLAFTLDLMVYPFDVRFSFNQTDDEVRNFMKKNDIKEDGDVIKYENDKSPARCVMFDSGAALIRLRKIPTTAPDFAALQHEITHYVMLLLFHKISMPHNLDTTEGYAYLTGYITGEVYAQLPKFGG